MVRERDHADDHGPDRSPGELENFACLRHTTFYCPDELANLEEGAVRLATIAIRADGRGEVGHRPVKMFQVIGTTIAGTLEPCDLKARADFGKELERIQKRHAAEVDRLEKKIANLQANLLRATVSRPRKKRSVSVA